MWSWLDHWMAWLTVQWLFAGGVLTLWHPGRKYGVLGKPQLDPIEPLERCFGVVGRVAAELVGEFGEIVVDNDVAGY